MPELRKQLNKQRLLIPTNNLQFLCEIYSNTTNPIRLTELHATTMLKTSDTPSIPIKFDDGTHIGLMKTNISNRILIDFKANGHNYAKTFEDFKKGFRSYKIPNAFISQLTYSRELAEGEVYFITFAKYTPHKTLDLGRILDGGAFPDQQLYNLRDRIREAFGERKIDYQFDRSSQLLLMSILPHPESIDNSSLLDSIKYPFMYPYFLSPKDWSLANAEFRRGYK